MTNERRTEILDYCSKYINLNYTIPDLENNPLDIDDIRYLLSGICDDNEIEEIIITPFLLQIIFDSLTIE